LIRHLITLGLVLPDYSVSLITCAAPTGRRLLFVRNKIICEQKYANSEPQKTSLIGWKNWKKLH
jgi:hypothetical protein